MPATKKCSHFTIPLNISMCAVGGEREKKNTNLLLSPFFTQKALFSTHIIFLRKCLTVEQIYLH